MNGKLFLKIVLVFLELPLKITVRIKRALIIQSFQSVGKNFLFDPLSSVYPSDGETQIGDNVFVGKNAYWGGKICIGNNVMFGPNSTLAAGNHIFAVRGKSPRFIQPFPGQNSEPIVVEDEVWVGANVLILGNVTVEIGSVIGAGSIVVNDVCPFTISVGSPCQPVRRIFDDETLSLHLEEIGYSKDFSANVVERRKRFLNNVNIPAIDKTEIYKSFVYQVL